MRKIKVTTPFGDISIHYPHPTSKQPITLCAINFAYDKTEETTEPITCPGCLAIIRECKEIEI